MKQVVRFHASWCGPCKEYQKHWEDFQEANTNESIEFIDVEVDVPGGAAWKKRVQITRIPLTVVFEDDNAVRSETGVLKHEQLLKLIHDKRDMDG